MANIILPDGVHPDPDLWFDDGNVVIEVGNIAFKLYRGMISRQSTVFRDILEGGRHGHGVEVSHNNSLVRLLDSVEDIRIMFLSITDPNFFQGPPHKYEANVILSIARTSHKYGITALYQRSIAHLTTVFPTNLTEWDAQESRTTLLRSRELNSGSNLANDYMQLFSTVFSIEAPWLRPAALYSTCQIPLSAILNTPTWRDPTSMSEQTRILLLIGHGVQRQMNSKVFEFLGYLPDERCQTYIACDRVCQNWIREESVWTDGHPLGNLEARYGQHLRRLCAACRGKCMRINRASRGIIWDNLPVRFQLGTWAELLVKRDSYLAIFSVTESPHRISRGPSRSSSIRRQSGLQVPDGRGW